MKTSRFFFHPLGLPSTNLLRNCFFKKDSEFPSALRDPIPRIIKKWSTSMRQSHVFLIESAVDREKCKAILHSNPILDLEKYIMLCY